MKIITLLLVVFTFTFSFTLDKKYEKDTSFIYSSHYYVPYITSYSLLAYSLYNGFGDIKYKSKFQKATTDAFKALVINQLTVEILKSSFARVRPRHNDDPNRWFQYNSNLGDEAKSFPSGHVATMATVATSYILSYKDETPYIYLLALLPIHQMFGRVKFQAHWTTDVLAGAAVGVASAFISRKYENILLFFSKDRQFIGIKGYL